MEKWMMVVAAVVVLLVAAIVAAFVAMTLLQMYSLPGGPVLPPGGLCQKPCHISLDGTNSCVRATEPMMCTMEYRLGDACVQYLQCTGDGFFSCQTVQTLEFEECIDCYKRCAASEVGFEGCENLCRPADAQ